MAKKKNKRVKPRNPLAIAVREDAAFRKRVVQKPRPKDYKPEINDDY